MQNNSYYVSLENLVLDQVMLPFLTFFFILIACPLEIQLILKGEVLFRSLMGFEELGKSQPVLNLNNHWLSNKKIGI